MQTLYDERYRKLIQLLKDKRKELGWTQTEAAKKLGFKSRSVLVRIEQGQRRLDLIEVHHICQVYGIRFSSLERILANEERP